MAINNVKVGATRSAEIIAEAAKTVTVTDSRGRSIEVRRPSNVTRRNARKAITAESQTKAELFGEYMLAFLVVAIDGEGVPIPSNETQTEALQDRLGDEGLVAVANAVTEAFSNDNAVSADEAKNS